jgi:hypothetical protein
VVRTDATIVSGSRTIRVASDLGHIWAVASATPGTWCNALCLLFLHYHSSRSDWQHGGLLVLRIMKVFLGFFLCQYAGLRDACPHRYDGSVVFQKSPLVYSTGRFLPRDCRLRWN